jgi:hypothetical protein
MDAGPMDLGCAPKESKCASEIGQKGRLWNWSVSNIRESVR